MIDLRRLERKLFGAWCQWLCYPSRSRKQEGQRKQEFEYVAAEVDRVLGLQKNGVFFLSEFSSADVVFVPYVERMVASLFFYKGFTLRDSDKYPNITQWFHALERRETYLSTQSDAHTQ